MFINSGKLFSEVVRVFLFNFAAHFIPILQIITNSQLGCRLRVRLFSCERLDRFLLGVGLVPVWKPRGKGTTQTNHDAILV